MKKIKIIVVCNICIFFINFFVFSKDKNEPFIFNKEIIKKIETFKIKRDIYFPFFWLEKEKKLIFAENKKLIGYISVFDFKTKEIKTTNYKLSFRCDPSCIKSSEKSIIYRNRLNEYWQFSAENLISQPILILPFHITLSHKSSFIAYKQMNRNNVFFIRKASEFSSIQTYIFSGYIYGISESGNYFEAKENLQQKKYECSIKNIFNKKKKIDFIFKCGDNIKTISKKIFQFPQPEIGSVIFNDIGNLFFMCFSKNKGFGVFEIKNDSLDLIFMDNSIEYGLETGISLGFTDNYTLFQWMSNTQKILIHGKAINDNLNAFFICDPKNKKLDRCIISTKGNIISYFIVSEKSRKFIFTVDGIPNEFYIAHLK